MGTGQKSVAVGANGVKEVRIGMGGQSRPSTRIVVDLEKACAYELTPGPAGKFVLTLHANAEAKAAAQDATVAASSPAPVKSEAAPASKESASPNNYVFVEPSYQAKAEQKAVASDDNPAARAQDAAAKFSDKTTPELLPVSMHAAQSQSNQAPTITPAVNLAAEQKAQSAQGNAVAGPKYTGEPISVNLKDVDLKDFFRLIHEISGLNVVLDPNVHGTLTIVLDDVPWDQALDIVLKNNDLARELEGNVLRIATVETLKKEADSRRAQIESEALAVEKVTVTRFLSYAHSKYVVPTIKKFLSSRGDIVSDDRSNAVIISDIPGTIPGVDRLIQQLDRKTQEVEIEARVISAPRSFARDIGTQLGFGWGNSPTAIGGATTVGTSPIIVGNTPSPSYIVSGGKGAVQIPLFSNLGVTGPTSGLSFINATNAIRIDAILTMAESRGLLKILSRPRVVTQNNIQAIVKQGVRVPVESAATLGAPATITYVDAFLKLTVTPQITVENTIFLNVDVENTTP